MDAFTMIIGVAGILLLLISLYELIAKKALLNDSLYQKYTKESADKYVRQEGLWGVVISVCALLIAASSWKNLSIVFDIFAVIFCILGLLMIRKASKKLVKK